MANIALIESPTYISRPAGSDLSTKQYFFMDITSGKLTLAGSGTRVAGVLCDDPAAEDRPGQLQIAGVAKVLAGGTITSGAGVASDAAGKAVAATGSAFVVGICVSLGTVASGEYAAVLLTPSGAVGQAGDVETIADAGALNPGILTTFLSVTGTVAYTLADGSYVGQRKRIECTVAASIPAGTVTLNDAATGEPTAWVFNAVGQMLELMWMTGGWKLMTVREAGTDTPAAASTLNLLVRTHIIAIDGTDDWILPSGEVPGETQSFIVSTADNIPAGTISGLFYDEDGSADGVDLVMNAIADLATVQWDGLRWVPIQLTSVTVS
ncbi:MAG: hypothetical protein EHM89_00155 [Acidobacteria bacterium]|nr:MAG: hypothetical protein EHM89_00155 [Acidobacteriota bacterium]